MKARYSWRLALCLAILVVLVLPQLASAGLAVRLVTDPKPSGPVVTMDSFVFEDNSLATAQFAVKNASTNLLTIDGARSSLTVAGGESRPLGTLLGKSFVTSLLPKAQTSDALDILAPVKAGDQVQLRLVWTLGAIVSSATWVWEIVDTSAPPTPAPTQTTPAGTTTPTEPSPASTPAAPATSQPASDFTVGLIGLAVGLLLVGLIALGIWALTR